MSLFPNMNEDLFSEYGSEFQGLNDLDGSNGGAADGSFVLSHGSVDHSAASSAASGASGTSDASASASSGASGMSDASFASGVLSTPSVLMNSNANASGNVPTRVGSQPTPARIWRV
jgi:hypothetical protein